MILQLHPYSAIMAHVGSFNNISLYYMCGAADFHVSLRTLFFKLTTSLGLPSLFCIYLLIKCSADYSVKSG